MGNIKKLVLASAVVGVAWFSATDAMAFHRHRWGGSYGCSGGSWGCSGATWGCSGGCWGCSGGCWGCSGGCYGCWGGGYYGVPHRWYRHGGCYGCWGCSGGYVGCSGGCWGCSGGCSGGCCGGCSGGVIYSDEAPADATPATPDATAPADAAKGKSAYIGAGLLLVMVPADAKVTVNGKETTSTGGERQYISRNLMRGSNYNFVVTATTVRNGKANTMTKTATLTAGASAELSFLDLSHSELDTASTQPLTTKLTVRVPADAKVYLAGNETRQTGEVREFSTTKLTAGEGWNGYTVRAEIEKDGKLISKEQVVSIDAGQSKEIAFDFSNDSSDAPIATTARK